MQLDNSLNPVNFPIGYTPIAQRLSPEVVEEKALEKLGLSPELGAFFDKYNPMNLMCRLIDTGKLSLNQIKGLMPQYQAFYDKAVGLMKDNGVGVNEVKKSNPD